MEEEKRPRKRGKRPAILPESEKKRRRKEKTNVYSKSRVILGAEITRWRRFKEENGLKTDVLVAAKLLDNFYGKPEMTTTLMMTSTPAQTSTSTKVPSTPTHSAEPVAGTSSEAVPWPVPFSLQLKRRDSPSVSEISAAGSESETQVSGVEAIPGTGSESSENGKQSKKQPPLTTHTGRKVEKKQLSCSFVDPFKPDDVNEEAEEVAYEEVEFGLEKDTDDADELVDEGSETIPGIERIKTPEDCEQLTSSVTCLAFVKQLKQLAQIHVTSCSTPDCSGNVNMKEDFVGSALYFRWVCENNHLNHSWCAQPKLNKRLHSGDFLSAATILISGNNYGKLALWAQMMNLKFLSAATFHRIQGTYLVPTIDSYWEEHQAEVLQTFKDKEIIVAGDGRNDSPGHSAQYVSYTLMEDSSKKILSIKTLDKRMTGRKSAALEKAAFQMAINEVLVDHNINVKEVVTDAHLGIGSLMKTNYPQIKHSNDIWHVAKNLGKKILKISKKKENAVLQKWSKDIVNHFWFACKKASTYNEFVSVWRSVLHHITNQHEWILPHGDGITACLHEPLNEEERKKPWLSPSKDAAALKALTNIVLDKKFLNRVGYYLNFRSTADLEVFHQHILMYCAKRFSYTPPVYRVRNKLAALDHNVHSEREVMRNKEGNIVYHRCFNKKSGRWSVFPHKVKKTYPHVRPMLKKALVMRIEDRIGMKGKRVLEEDDPRRISKTLAVEKPPPTETIVKEKLSRFDKP